MNYDVRDTCGKRRGCTVLIVLPYDSQLKPIYSRMYGTRNDTKKVLSTTHISVDKKLETTRPLEKMVA